MMRPAILLLSAIAACMFAGLLPESAHAGAILTYDETQQGAARSDGPFTIGTLFHVGQDPVTITHLGAQDADAADDAQDPDGADGLTGFADDDGFFGGPISVGLWSADGSTLLGSASVSSSDVLIDSWRYAPIDQGPLTLQAETDYLIGALVGATIEWFIDDENAPPAFGADSGITLLENRFFAGAFGAPTSNGSSLLGRWGPANAIFLPEPSSVLIWGLLSMGAMAFAWRKRIRRLG